MKSALKKSVVSTSISLILASGMAAFAAHAADDVKLKATKTNVAFSDFTPTEYSTKGKPNIIVLTMDDLGYGQLPFDKGSFDPKTMENREVVDTYKIGIDKAIEAAQKSTPTLLSLMDEGVRFTNGYVAHGVSGPSRAAIMTGRAPARFGVYSNTAPYDQFVNSGQNGLLVSNDVGSWKSAIQFLLDNPSCRAEILANAERDVHLHFNTPAVLPVTPPPVRGSPGAGHNLRWRCPRSGSLPAR